MGSFITKLIDLFDPKMFADCIVCGVRLPVKYFEYAEDGIGVCRDCHEKLPIVPVGKTFSGRGSLDYSMSAFYYLDPIRSIIIDFKFKDCTAYGKILSHYLNTWASILFDGSHYFNMIIPVPLSEKRLKERGYNQAALLSDSLAIEYGIMHTERALRRVRATSRQTDLTSYDRFKNVQNAFEADPNLAEGRRILIVDDVYTTGNTISACARELKNKGADKVVALTLARARISERSQEFRELLGM